MSSSPENPIIRMLHIGKGERLWICSLESGILDPVRIAEAFRVRQLGPYQITVASTPGQLEEVYRLNYATFVTELGQYEGDGSGRLVDKFDEKNTYLIALRDSRVVGMVCVHGQPPFSTEQRLADPSILKSIGGKLLEVRLLAIDPGERQRMVFAGLLWCVQEYAREEGYTRLLISGYLKRVAIYERLGFRPLGPPVRSGQVEYVPMVMALDGMPERIRREIEVMRERFRRAERSAGAG
jgi:N-acyl-L-homoserine lactone synthetase